MALRILDESGNDLQTAPPVPVVLRTPVKHLRVGLVATVVEDDPNLMFKLVGADLSWDDGRPPIHYPTSSATAETTSPLSLATERDLSLGKHQVRLTAYNNRAPVADVVSATWVIEVATFNVSNPPTFNVHGPILPRDDGFPNAQEWLFNLSSGLSVLQSSVKMLLMTALNERLMLPDYGTKLRRYLFDPNTQSIETLLQQEIAQALATYEPRVKLMSAAVTRDPNRRSVSVAVDCASQYAAAPFQVNLQFTV